MRSLSLLTLQKLPSLSGFDESCTELQIHNAYRVNIILVIVAFLATTVPLVHLTVTASAWQHYALIVLGVLLAVAAIVGARLSRRQKSLGGMMIMIGAVQLNQLVISALLAEIGLVMALVTVTATLAVAVQTLPSRAVAPTTFVSFGIGIVSGLLDLLRPDSQLFAPGMATFYLALGSGLLIIYGYRAVRQFHSCSLSSKLMLTFLMVALVPLGLLAYLNGRVTRAALTDEANQVLFGLASETAASLDAFIITSLDEVHTESQFPEMVGFLLESSEARPENSENAEIIDLLRVLSRKDETNIASYALLNSEGIIVADTYTPDIGLDKSGNAFFQETIRSDEPNVSPIVISPSTQEPSLIFSSAVRDETGVVLGVLRLRYRADILQQLLVQKNGIAGEDSFGVLFDEHQIHLAHGYAPETILIAVAPLSTSEVTALQAANRLPDRPEDELAMNLPDLEENLANSHQQPFFTAEDIATGDRMNQVAVTTLETQPWMVAFFQPQDVFLTPVVTQTRTTLLLATILSGVVVVAAVGMGHLLADPLVELTAAVSDFTEGNMKAHASIRTGDEMGMLAASFNTMAAQVGELLKSLEERTVELEQEKEQAEAIFSSAGDAIVIIDPQGQITSVNPGFEAQTGFRSDEALGFRLERLLIHETSDPQSSIPHMIEAINNGQPWRGGLLIECKDGTHYPADLNIAPLRRRGRVRGFVGALRDTSAQQELNRMKDAFVSNVSHELRTPITSIKLYTSLLEKALPPEQAGKFIPTLRRESDRLQLIIEDLLRLSRLDQEQVDLNLQPVNLNSMAETYVGDRVPLAEERGLSLTLEATNDLPMVDADEGLLGQALSILLTNALSYTPEGGHVIVKTIAKETTGGSASTGKRAWAGFAIVDTGPGIAPQEQTELFQRFYRGKAGLESGASGTGLGLAIAREITRRHRGQIEVESEGIPGKGTTFTIWLPVTLA